MARFLEISACVAMGLIAPASAAPHGCEPLRITIADTGDGIYELTASGDRFTSRDDVEARLLVETAKFTLTRNSDWFELVPMPGEATGTHPNRPPPSYGAGYVNWHPQWAYKLKGERWLSWRPEWAAAFWADSVDPTQIVGFEAEALVRIGSGIPESPEAIDARKVIADLGNRYCAAAAPSGHAQAGAPAAGRTPQGTTWA